MMAARESEWNERRLIGSVRLHNHGVYVSVVTYPGGKKSVALSVGKNGETPRGMVMGAFLARTLRDLLNEAIEALDDGESGKRSKDRERFVEHVIAAATHGRSVGLSTRPGPLPPGAKPSCL